ncbi:efflux RND transporter periplasmic adaptor subunit [Pseudoxanthomonas taiwanensis]|jgi:RND family efflux transporter, MFP subunit|uniref:Efflux transporter periplasmic adaptor subunit n=1 Tax=Pseudoxanthomonas taiwanensis TaxID=176598 RepID=A0A921P648_9GAMM|nr:efflux RND transporter periplasmic adaptor subunit [Pseudoxanthomonas taiwanensis]KAF1690724.1 efflux transporter periplasmic adaptor subunit [Pseudoxanthomonas taiwanensis]MBO2467530.1 efflux RND transporter periplasmic adaptor subunit [Xanthomonadaceae bacterium]
MNASSELLRQLRIERDTAPPPPPRRGLWIGLGIAAVVLLAAGAWLAFGRDRGVEVRTATALAAGGGGSATSVLDASGYVVARRMATVSAKVTGRVKEVLIEEGMRVEEGQVLARLDPVDAEQQLALAASQLEAARSQLGAVQAQLKEAEANAVRLQALAAQKLVSQAQYDQAVAQRDTLRSQLATAQRNVRVAEDGLRIAGQGVENTIVVAPFSGVITAKAAQEGEIVSPLSAGGGFTRTGIGTIVDMDSLEVEVDVGEAYIGRVRPKMPVEATLNSYPDWKIPAEVVAIIPAADRGKATVKVRVALKEKDPRIVPDMGVTVSFLERDPGRDEAPRRGVRVPAAAVVERDGATVVFVVDERQRVELRPVQAGDTVGQEREVLSGLAPGETVVVGPPERLADGDRVRTAE